MHRGDPEGRPGEACSPKFVVVDALAGQPMFLTEPGCNYRRVFEREVARRGAELGRHLEFDNVEAIRQCVVAEFGISVLPEVTVERDLERGELVGLEADPTLLVET